MMIEALLGSIRAAEGDLGVIPTSTGGVYPEEDKPFGKPGELWVDLTVGWRFINPDNGQRVRQELKLFEFPLVS